MVNVGYTNGVEFDADSYVEWQDSQNNYHTLIVRIKSGQPGSKTLSNDETDAIRIMENGRAEGTKYFQDVLYIDMSDVTGTSNSFLIDPANNGGMTPIKTSWNWAKMSAGSIVRAQLERLDLMYQ
ncbi:hypothetical protein ACFLYT_00190 [Nanoarchaeota archaeon]